jgi:hypothetical protein
MFRFAGFDLLVALDDHQLDGSSAADIRLTQGRSIWGHFVGCREVCFNDLADAILPSDHLGAVLTAAVSPLTVAFGDLRSPVSVTFVQPFHE